MTIEYKKILVAFDASEQSKVAVEHAKLLSRLNHGHVTILQVLEPIIDYLAPDSYVISELTKSQKEIQKNLKRTLENNYITQNDQNIDVKVLIDTPKEAIVKFARENNFDIIVMGATGKHGINKLLMGSTASYVVNHAPCTVLTVK